MSQPPIGREELTRLFIEASPSFEQSEEWKEFWTDYGDEPELWGYLLVSALARHLVDLLAAGKTEEFDPVFDLVELLHVRGDRYVQELATVGILEDLQNANIHHDGTTPDDFVQYLRPVSKWWWEELELFWSGKGLLGTSGRPRPPGMPDPMQEAP